ncbi:MAG: DoxX family protein [Methylotenera sp.]|nr:DoxX family protein [Methylotenera sp.]
MQNFSLVTCGINSYKKAISYLDFFADSLPQLLLRLILAWEFGKAGLEKLHGTNWFADITFPFPFNLLPPGISWHIATFFEIAGAAALIIGLATRFFSISLIILTIVAIAAVHWPEHWSTLGELTTGFRIVDETNDGFGNYELPLLFIVMLLPLLFGGAGKLSVDYLLKRKC